MARGQRDYKAEYRRRIESGRLRGLSTAQARGHRLANEAAVSRQPARPIDEHSLQVALKELRKQKSISRAAKSARISRERFRRIAVEKGLIQKAGRHWQVTGDLIREMTIFSNGRQIAVKLPNFEQASLAGSYMAVVSQFLRTNDVSLLASFSGHGVTDASGQFHPFETNPNKLYRLSAASDRGFESIYRIIL